MAGLRGRVFAVRGYAKTNAWLLVWLEADLADGFHKIQGCTNKAAKDHLTDLEVFVSVREHKDVSAEMICPAHTCAHMSACDWRAAAGELRTRRARCARGWTDMHISISLLLALFLTKVAFPST